MCGIAGKMYFNEQRRVPEQDIERMAQAIAHRGPDHTGIKTVDNVGLTNTRLAIIDLSSQGWQPMADADQKLWIVFNGEIYNYQELRDKLIAEGIKFKSTSDTEVVLYLYKKYKEHCLDHLRGMFAMAIWDAEQKHLFVARDRVGKKPFKYYLDNEQFLFASELKAILTDPAVKPEPDFEAIHHYLSLQYCPAPLTGFSNIKKLPAGHWAIIKNGRIDIRQYWKPIQAKEQKLTEGEWIGKIRSTIEESVRLRMIASDVPVAAMLSGGIDSSAVVAYMSRFSSKPVDTFSVWFKNSSINELGYARTVANTFHTRHHEIEIDFDHFTQTIQEIAEHFEEPFADTSAVPTWYIAKAIHPFAKVVLGGDGGDENFFGYNKYNMMQGIQTLHRMGARFLSPAAHILPTFGLLGKIKRRAGMVSGSPEQAFLDMISFFHESDLPEKYRGTTKNLVSRIFQESNSQDLLRKINYFDFSTYLADDLNVKTDIATMAFALELRSPLLDHTLIELTNSIPNNLKLRGNTNKYIFKKAMQGIVPSEIFNRPKQGFGVPLNDWFAKQEITAFIQSILLSKQALTRPWITKETIEKLVRNPTPQSYTRLWALLTLELWFRKYF